MAKLRPARGKKKDQPGTKGRLISCVVLLAIAMFLFFYLFRRALG